MVDFPHPERPIKLTNWFSSTVKLTPPSVSTRRRLA
ncbi:hypothetical protein HNR02_005033 [Amycolatopsis endophytica]|uniref:Uncharacterized protein n=1 Tax=Amycolatopsis endophytica TaxID=860233 RepID=A0A853B9N4_9PSEU|nr:hypothetical protein [Amycolatopsis endophytica]